MLVVDGPIMSSGFLMADEAHRVRLGTPYNSGAAAARSPGYYRASRYPDTYCRPRYEYHRFWHAEHQGGTWLIPLRDPEQRLAQLDFSGMRMYAVDEVLLLLHELARKVVDQLMSLQRSHAHACPASCSLKMA